MILGALTGAVIALVLLSVTLYGLVLDARAATASERVRVDDLLSRLAARTHGEYAAFSIPQPEPMPSQSFRFDPTGMIGVEDDGG